MLLSIGEGNVGTEYIANPTPGVSRGDAVHVMDIKIGATFDYCVNRELTYRRVASLKNVTKGSDTLPHI